MESDMKTNRYYFTPAYTLPKCNVCKHYQRYGKCEAFPNGIPVEVLDQENVYPSCNGKDSFHFEKRE